MTPQRIAVHHDSQPLRQRECAAQLSIDHKLSQTPVGEAGSAYARLLREYVSRGRGIRRWAQNGRDPLSDLGGDSGPYQTRPKRNGCCVFSQSGVANSWRLNVGGFHDLISRSIRTEEG